jgi:phenylalanyl-tRNA synthetase beta chain
MITEPTYLPGRGAKVMLRPRKSAETNKTSTESESESKSHEGPLQTIAHTLKAALPGVKSHSDSPVPTISRDVVIGSLGILHPSVLANFELVRPCSALEIDVEPFL